MAGALERMLGRRIVWPGDPLLPGVDPEVSGSARPKEEPSQRASSSASPRTLMGAKWARYSAGVMPVARLNRPRKKATSS